MGLGKELPLRCENKRRFLESASRRLQSAEGGRAACHWVLPHRSEKKRSNTRRQNGDDKTASRRLQSAEDGRAACHWVLPHRSKTKRSNARRQDGDDKSASRRLQSAEAAGPPATGCYRTKARTSVATRDDKTETTKRRAGSFSSRRKTSKTSGYECSPRTKVRGSPKEVRG